MATVTIKSKMYGFQTINIDTFDANRVSSDSTIFKVVEHLFNDWFEHNTQPGAPCGKDIEFCYYGDSDEPAVYSKRGAIIQGIEEIIEFVRDSGRQLITTKDILNMDIEAAFQI